MKLSIVLVAVVLSLALVVGAKKHHGDGHSKRQLFVATCESVQDTIGLAKNLFGVGFKVHGYYGDLIVASAKKHKVMASSAGILNIKEMTSLGHRDRSLSYFVLERQEKEYEEALKVSSDFVTVLYSSFNRVVVSVPTKNVDVMENNIDLISADDLEILPIDLKFQVYFGIKTQLQGVVESIYTNATAKYMLAPNPTVTKLVELVSPAELKKFVTYLTGEDGQSTILTRNSRSTGAKEAAVWIGGLFKQYGLEVSNQIFRTDYSANVIGIKQGATDPSKIVVIGAHYDSRGPDSTSTTQRAPGANDNGSGTGAVLQIAKIFFDSNVKFDYTIHFIVYSGEEQGLYGSGAYAQKLLDEKATVVGVINADMVAYRAPGEKTQCAFPSRYSTPELQNIAKAATSTYVPELTIGTTTACCSDHQSYYTRGLPATGFFERNGGIADVQYHKSADLVERVNFDIEGQYTQLTKAILASVAILAGVN